jgi:serine protease Do
VRLLIAFAICTLLAACANDFQKFYKPYVDPRTLSDVHLLGDTEQPKIFGSDDLQRDVKIAMSKGYRPIGESSFNGKVASEQAASAQAKTIGAVLVLINSKFTDTRTITTPLFLPNNQTTYNSGTVYGMGGSANYSGTNTTYGTTVVPITTQQQRYDQHAVYFVKVTKKPKFGLFLLDLTPELRSKYERNAGAIVNVVVEESPAFIANILAGDILLEINGASVLGAKQGAELMQSTNPPDGKCILKVIRNGTEKAIPLQFL